LPYNQGALITESNIKSEVGAIIVAAGVGTRMGGVEKIRSPLGGQPVLSRVVAVFVGCAAVNRIVIVLAESNIGWGKALVAESGWSKVTSVCPGGARRQDSVAAGLKELDGCDWVIVHDGARPLLREKLISDGLAAAQETGAAAAAVPVNDTIKLAGDDRVVEETLPRERLWVVQTPQLFRHDVITAAYREVAADVTDDAALVEQWGGRVKLYPGAYDNIKVTTQFDLALAGVLLESYEE